jgi:hypothetical protein
LTSQPFNNIIPSNNVEKIENALIDARLVDPDQAKLLRKEKSLERGKLYLEA